VGAYRYFLGGAAILPWLPSIKSGGAGRSFVKRRFLRATLGGMPVAQLQKAALAFQDVLATVIRPEMVARIRLHQQCGHQVVLVSASPSIYLKPWADAMGVRHVLATELALDGASFQGALSSPNCWGPEKVVRLKSWWKQQAPDTLYVYGDSRGDKEMAELATHSWIRGVDQAFPPLDR
jgi:phosphatidylglycerophosphatase C